MKLEECFLMPQVVNHGAQMFRTAHGEGPGAPENIWLSNPAKCGECETMRIFFINRFGSTRCFVCDMLAEKERMEAN